MSKTETIELKVPAWVRKDKMENKLLDLFRADILTKVEYYRSQMEVFKDKYKMSFPELKRKIEAGKDENFREWDDFIEWEANLKAYQEWERKYEELTECLK